MWTVDGVLSISIIVRVSVLVSFLRPSHPSYCLHETVWVLSLGFGLYHCLYPWMTMIAVSWIYYLGESSCRETEAITGKRNWASFHKELNIEYFLFYSDPVSVKIYAKVHFSMECTSQSAILRFCLSTRLIITLWLTPPLGLQALTLIMANRWNAWNYLNASSKLL